MPDDLEQPGGGSIFVCHATDDRPVAEAVCAALESHGIPCWIAPRDVPAGASYADTIVAAIARADVLLLIYSGAADASPHVRRELEQAVNRSLRIVPVRIEEREPSPEVRYYLGSWQWLDAFPPPVDAHLDRVIRAVTNPAPLPTRLRRLPRWLVGVGAAVGVALVAVVVALAAGGGGSGDDEAAERVRACVSTHGLSKPTTKRVPSADRVLFQACAWPPAPGADGDGFSEITVASGPGPGASESEGLTVTDTFRSGCAELELKYLFDNQGSFVADRPFRIAKGELRRVEDGSRWTPRTEAEADIYTPVAHEFVVLSNRRYRLDLARCI